MTPDQVVLRARSALGHGCIYGLGCGGMNPQRTVPWDENMRCDCSGFAMWCLGLSRRQGGIWMDSSRIRLDAIDGGSLFNAVPWNEADLGDLLVYGDSKQEDGVHQGHVGVVSQASRRGPALVISCSHGAWMRNSDAIGEDIPTVFQFHPQMVVARCLTVQRVPV